MLFSRGAPQGEAGFSLELALDWTNKAVHCLPFLLHLSLPHVWLCKFHSLYFFIDGKFLKKKNDNTMIKNLNTSLTPLIWDEDIFKCCIMVSSLVQALVTQQNEFTLILI